MPKPETKLEEAFTTLVRRAGGITEKMIPGRAGVPDRLVLFAGRVYLVELKTETGYLEPIQRVWHDRAAAIGVQVWTLYGKADVLAWVALLGEPLTPQARAALWRLHLTRKD